MSTLTPAEKRRLLQERRKAKMAEGKASDRLNNILNQGSSVKASTASSVLDNPVPTKHKAHPDDDPDTSDIEQLISARLSPGPEDLLKLSAVGSAPTEQDFEKLIQNMFGVADDGSAPGGSDDPLTSMMMNMMKDQQSQSGASSATLENQAYENQLLQYKLYTQKALNFKFLIIRYLAVIINFSYHFLNFKSFRASSHAYVRNDLASISNKSAHQFAIIFISIEAVILSSYFLITSRKKASGAFNGDNLLLKGISLVSMVLPAIQSYKPIIAQLVNYWELVRMLLGDLSLLVVLFGITSFSG